MNKLKMKLHQLLVFEFLNKNITFIFKHRQLCSKVKYNFLTFTFILDRLDQWFSTFGSWRPTKQNNTQFGDPFITIIVLYQGFWRPKSMCPRPKIGLRPTC